MSGRTLDDFESKHDPKPEVAHLRDRVASLTKRYEAERKAHGELREALADLEFAVSEAKPIKMIYKPEKRSGTPCTHVVHLTDLHMGEITKKNEIEGINEFSPEIAERRMQQLVQATTKNTYAQRGGHNVPHLHVIGTADYISGDIHPELQVTNAFPCPVQAVRCGYMLGAAFEAWAPHFETVTVDLVTLDNHGRLTKGYQSSEGGLNNWSYVVAEIAKQFVKRIGNIKVNVHAVPTALVIIEPESYLCFHGHQMKGWAGKPYYGFDRRVAMEAVKRMNAEGLRFTKLIFGHYHTATNEKDWQLGGSLSGTNTFDHSQGRACQAHQTSWLVHPEHGEFGWTRWWLV